MRHTHTRALISFEAMRSREYMVQGPCVISFQRQVENQEAMFSLSFQESKSTAYAGIHGSGHEVHSPLTFTLSQSPLE